MSFTSSSPRPALSSSFNAATAPSVFQRAQNFLACNRTQSKLFFGQGQAVTYIGWCTRWSSTCTWNESVNKINVDWYEALTSCQWFYLLINIPPPCYRSRMLTTGLHKVLCSIYGIPWQFYQLLSQRKFHQHLSHLQKNMKGSCYTQNLPFWFT